MTGYIPRLIENTVLSARDHYPGEYVSGLGIKTVTREVIYDGPTSLPLAVNIREI